MTPRLVGRRALPFWRFLDDRCYVAVKVGLLMLVLLVVAWLEGGR